MRAGSRTIEVVYTERQTWDGTESKWEVLHGGVVMRRHSKKKLAVKDSRDYAKKQASQHGLSYEVKIFKKNGDWQEENVYEP